MSRTRGVLWLVVAMNSAACSRLSPAAPVAGSTAEAVFAESAAPPGASAAATVLPGTYTLTFHDTSGAEVSSLPILRELVLRAHVTDSAGQPAQRGSVTFQYCSLKGLPTNDITRADEAPMSECASGAARWRNLLSTPVNASGEAAMGFGFVRIPRIIGFRFKYDGGRTIGIASGIGGPRDIEFTAP